MKPFLPTCLYLDTTGKTMQVGLSIDGAMVFSDPKNPQDSGESPSHRYHTARLLPTIADALKSQGLSPQDLQTIALNIGPGSFTGVRTAVVVAKTLGQFLNLPLYGFNTFELLAFSHSEGLSQPVALYLDALQHQAYHTVVTFEDGKPVYAVPPGLISLDTHQTDSEANLILASQSLQDYFSTKSYSAVRFLEGISVFTPQAMLGLLNQQPDRPAETWESLSPLYLQNPNITLRKPKAGTFR